MKLTRATHLLAGLLVVMSHQVFMAQDRNSQVLFENADFKVFSVQNPEVLPAISEPATFGVFRLKEQDAVFLRNTSGLSFTGSSRQPSILVYGTPEGVLPYIDNARFFNAGRRMIWVVPKFEAEITEPVFRQNLPASFTQLVRDDVFAIGALADRAAVGQQPTEKELSRARAAINDLSFKSRWFSFYGNPATAPPQIYVKVRTLKEGQEIKDCKVWYVPLGWEGEKDHTIEFDKHSSPTYQWMNPGGYKMWASRGGKTGVMKQVAVGDTPGTSKEIDLEVP